MDTMVIDAYINNSSKYNARLYSFTKQVFTINVKTYHLSYTLRLLCFICDFALEFHRCPHASAF